MLGQRFATRINSFASGATAYWPDLGGKPSLEQMIARAATVDGLTELDLNYPDHVGDDPVAVGGMVRDCGLQVSGLAMRYYTNPAYKLGAFTNPDPVIRREAIDLTRRGIDAARAMGAPMMTLWLGQDGWDYAFQCDYPALWADEISGIAEVAAHDPDCLISLEYKPNEPRAYAVLPDAATTLLAIAEVGLPNLGVTIDFAHSLYADEQPAFAAALVQSRSRLLGLHLNDGYAKRDDGLMVGAVHEQATLELLRAVHRGRFDGAIYFDTFPDASGLDPVAECAANIRTVRRMLEAVTRMEGDNRLTDAQGRQDPITAQEIARQALAGATRGLLYDTE
jgi:sugar phosphate isomerase/epimerase